MARPRQHPWHPEMKGERNTVMGSTTPEESGITLEKREDDVRRRREGAVRGVVMSERGK